MVNLKLEVIRFEEPDIIATSGLGMTMSNFGDEVLDNGTFSFFGGSSGDESHNAHDTNIESAFNSYFGGSWEKLGITLFLDGGDDELRSVVANDTKPENDGPGNLKYNGTYTFKNGFFYMRSN